MEQADLTVRRIKDGTVIDHIDVGNGLKVLEALRIDGSDGNVITVALNVPSGKLKKKDMIKVEESYKKMVTQTNMQSERLHQQSILSKITSW